jgi:hypothetical protein
MSHAARNRQHQLTQRKYHLDGRIQTILDADDKSAKDSDKLNPSAIAEWFGVSIPWVFARRFDPRFPVVDEHGLRRRGDLRRFLRERLAGA